MRPLTLRPHLVQPQGHSYAAQQAAHSTLHSLLGAHSRQLWEGGRRAQALHAVRMHPACMPRWRALHTSGPALLHTCVRPKVLPQK